MKRLLLVLLLSLALAAPAYATEETETPTEETTETTETLTTETTADDKNIIVNVTLPAAAAAEAAAEDTQALSEDEETAAEAVPDFAAYTTYELDAADTGDTSEDPDRVTLKETVAQLFGPYEPRTQTVTEYLSDGSSVSYTQVIPGVAGLDHEWISSVCLFGLMTFCVFKFIGGICK